MAEVIIMPKLGFNMSEGKLVEWYKQEGESVTKGEPFFSVETDKTNMDIEATGDGVVRKLFINAGDTIPVTLPIAIVGGADENIDALVAEALSQLAGEGVESASAETSQASEKPARAGAPAVSAASDAAAAAKKAEGSRLMISPRARRVMAENGLTNEDVAEVVGTGWEGGICEKDILEFLASNVVRISPVARNMAAAAGLDIKSIKGSGVNGKVMKADVEAAITAQKKSESECACECAEAKFSEDGREILEEVPYTGIRKIIGEKMAASKRDASHIYFTKKVNMEKVLKLRKEVNAAQDKKTSVTDFIARAVVLALQKYPDINSAFLGDKIVKYKTINLGIAVAAASGLIVPTVKGAEKMSVVEISKASSELVEKARKNKLMPMDYSCGTFTISNLGMFGIDNFTAVINPPEAGIMAVSATKDEPVVITKPDGTKEIAIKPMMNIQVSVDHRVVDGLLAAQFTVEVQKLLEDPIKLLV